MKKQKLLFYAILLMAMALPQNVFAYDFSAVLPSGDTLYYNFISSDGVQVTFPGANNWNGFTTPTGALTIPSTVFYGGNTYNVISIGNYAFKGCTRLTSVTIPNSVTSIGDEAFTFCIRITSVTIPNSVTTIGQLAFSTCNCLPSVTIPNSVISIGNSAFNVVRHIEYHGSATGSPWGAFYMNCVTDGDFIFSDSNRTNLLVYIGSGGSVSIPSTVTSIGYRAFYSCSGLTSIAIPNSVTSIGSQAFHSSTGLTSVTIPNSVTSIGYSAFKYVKHIEYHGSATGSPWDAISMNGVVDGDFVFSDSTGTNLLAYIGSGGAVSIPNSVTSIGNSAFYYCIGLTSVTIPNSVTSIGAGAFNYCSGLTTVNYNAINCTSMGGINYPVFYDCGNLSTVIIGNSVTNIPAYTFCSSSSLTSISIGSDVTFIDYAAFADCNNLASVTVQNDNPPTLESYAFYNVPNTCSLIVPCQLDSLYRASNWGTWFSNIVADCSEPNSTYYDFWSVAPSGDTLYYIILDSNSVTVVHPFASDTTEQAWWDGAVQPTGTLTIPATVTHNDTTYTMVRISEHAFYNCSTLTSVTIPSTVDSIGEWAFAYNTNLTTVSMGSAVTTIGYGAFYGCSSLNNLVIPDSLITIGSHAFSGCNVTSLTIPNTVTSIGSYAFSDWSGLTTITIPRSMTYIGDWAFAGCDSLTTVIFNADSCTYMGSSAAPVFDNDAQFNTLRIGNTVRYIPSNAFYGCSGIHTVNIPTSVSTIGDSAFANCSGLVSITSKRTVAPTAGANTFNGVTDTIPIYIPCGSTASYASAWPHFTNFVEEMDAHVWVRSADVTMGTARVSVQPTCDTPYATIVATPNAGYLFALWSDGDTLNPRTLMIDRDTALTAFFVPMPDTVINYDTIIVRDTLLIHDTTVVNNYIHDTTIVHDTSYVDVFIHDTTIVHDTTYVEVLVHDTTIVNNYIHDTAYVHDTTIVNNYIHDTTYINNYIFDTTIVNNYIHDTTYVHDTTIVNNYIHDTTYVDNYIYDTVLVAMPIDYYTLTLTSEQPSMGIVVGSGTYSDSTEVEIAAVAICGYHFVQWSDGNTESPRHVTMTGDLELAASFASDEVGITDVPSSNAHITVHGNVITVQGAEGQRVRIFDSVGRLLSTDQSVSETQHFRMMAAGVYLLQVGDGTAQRVVVGIAR
jgi:hypothetical protein